MNLFYKAYVSFFSTPSPRYYYQKRVVPGPQYGYVEQDNRPVPSVPIQVPLQAQFAPYSNLQNVQLVPCLCPVSQENFQEQQVPYETVYFNPNYQVPPPPQHHPQQNMQTPPHQPQKP